MNWKCNWLECTNGAGLSGRGVCSHSSGQPNNPNCPYFEKTPCTYTNSKSVEITTKGMWWKLLKIKSESFIRENYRKILKR